MFVIADLRQQVALLDVAGGDLLAYELAGGDVFHIGRREVGSLDQLLQRFFGVSLLL